MRLVLSQKDFSDALEQIMGAVPDKTTLPVLQHVWIDTTGGRMFLQATDMEVAIRTAIDAPSAQNGKALIPAKLLAGIVGKLPECALAIATDDNDAMKVSSPKAQYTVHGLPEDEYMQISEMDGDQTSVTLESAQLLKMIKAVQVSISKDSSLPQFTGALLKIDGDVLSLTATDSYRLSRAQITIDNAPTKLSIIIPGRALRLVAKLIAKHDGPVNITTDGSRASFGWGHTELTTKLIDSSFPNCDRVLDKTYAIACEVSTESLSESLARVDMIAITEAHRSRVSTSEDLLLIVADCQETGIAREEMSARCDGEISLFINTRLLIDAVGTIDSELTALCFIDPTQSIKITPVGTDDIQHIIMPMADISDNGISSEEEPQAE